MNINRAIKELEEPDWLVTEGHTPEYTEAVQLGIEALKWRQRFVNALPRKGRILLPGETE